MLDYFPVRSVHFSQPRNGAFMLRHVFLIWAKLNIWVALWVYRAFRVWFVFFFSFRFFYFLAAVASLLLHNNRNCFVFRHFRGASETLFSIHATILWCPFWFGIDPKCAVLRPLSSCSLHAETHTSTYFRKKNEEKKNERQVHPLSSWSNNNVNKTTWRQRPRQPNVYYK